jgi:hypothetical protein
LDVERLEPNLPPNGVRTVFNIVFLGLDPVDLRQLQALVGQALKQVGQAVAEVIMRFDSEIEALPEEFLAPYPGKQRGRDGGGSGAGFR